MRVLRVRQNTSGVVRFPSIPEVVGNTHECRRSTPPECLRTLPALDHPNTLQTLRPSGLCSVPTCQPPMEENHCPKRFLTRLHRVTYVNYAAPLSPALFVLLPASPVTSGVRFVTTKSLHLRKKTAYIYKYTHIYISLDNKMSVVAIDGKCNACKV